jgi:hypothetical protein
MSVKHEKIRSSLLFYCFVDFQESREVRPFVYVMPSADVADTITAAHKQWLETPGSKGQAHKDYKMGRLLPDYAKTWATDNPYPAGWLARYSDAWHVLNLEPSDPVATIG